MATFTQGFHSSKLEEQPEVTLSHGPTDSPIRKRVFYDSSLVPNVTGFSQAVIPSGSSVERHVHASKYETFFCLNGQGKLIVGQNEEPCGEDHELALEKGCCITVAPRFWHSVHNTGDQDLIVIYFGVACSV